MAILATEELLVILTHEHRCVNCGDLLREGCSCQQAAEKQLCPDCDGEVYEVLK